MDKNLNNWTPEPWVIELDAYDVPSITADGKDVIPSLRNSDADLSRIVACVNACAGLTNDELDAIAKTGGLAEVTIGNWIKLNELHDTLMKKLDAIEMCLNMADDCAIDAGLGESSSTSRVQGGTK